ncbi:MAG: Dipeptidyl aminopeptidase BIII [Candidatus Anoxychlamydiales bacterium]|nr:Dipeptidyl aminopeptidase BIII [Candidatus Anoxychlamydiales bacterium]NGX35692.1 Dipeptidyl aminopeptidase BIII [Candidatus Anoxychlamydiales bacterium]
MGIEKDFGSWKSPITSDMIVKEGVKFLNIFVDDKDIYISELRGFEKGRSTILKYNGKTFDEVLDKKFNARTKVHEYGGLSFFIKDEKIYFSNFEDQQIYKKDLNGNYYPITPVSNDRYANYIVDDKRNVIYAVQEEHLETEVNNSIVKIDENQKIEKIAFGYDFYSSIDVNASKTKMVFLAWNHPDMPWDAAKLFIADIQKDGTLKNITCIAGSENESIFQPRWAEDGYLYFVSDKSNFWNLYRYRDGVIESIYPMDAEFGEPLWLFGMSTYDFYIDDGKLFIVATYNKNGRDNLCLIDPENKTKEDIKTKNIEFSKYSNICVIDSKVLFVGASPTKVDAIVSLDLKNKDLQILKKSKIIDIDHSYISEPQNIEFPTEDDQSAYMIYYPPKNKDYLSKKNNKPPLIVKSHGGPTAQSLSVLNLEIQYWTSRGFAFADVNYAGSTGYGREYRQRLYGNWGIKDVDDCANAAKYLAKKGLVDENKLIIKGGSAGGYTTLAALTFRDTFQAGASYYGICDLELFHGDTHKFEAKYDEKLLGPYPEKKQVYFDRSPINFIEHLSCPIILFQGQEDKIVLPNQAKKMFDSLNEKKLPTAYLLFEKEGHGFRSADVIKKTLEAELYFYSKIFGFEIEDDIEPIDIKNL